MSEKIIVLVSDKGDSKHGEISVFDDPVQAEKLVETLLEAGFEEDRIKVFNGKASEFQVSHRPVVALVGDGEDEERQASAPITNDGARALQAPLATADVTEAGAPKAEAAEDGTGATEAHVNEGDTQEGPASEATAGAEEPIEEDATPVKFSSLIRSA